MKEDDLIITINKGQDADRFIIKGRMNAVSAPELERKIEKAIDEGTKNIVLNMFEVEFLSSAGIRVILKIHKQMSQLGGKFNIERPSENVRNVLGMTALDEMLIKY